MIVFVWGHPQIQVVPVPVIVGWRIVFVFFRGCLHYSIIPCFKFSDLFIRDPFCRCGVVLMYHFLYERKHLSVPCKIFFILHTIPEVTLYVHHTLLMVRTISIKACFVIMDQDSAKSLHRRIFDPGMTFAFSCKVHCCRAIAAYDDIVIVSIDPGHRAVHMNHRCIKQCIEQFEGCIFTDCDFSEAILQQAVFSPEGLKGGWFDEKQQEEMLVMEGVGA